ncbi:phage terminase large subunit GpA-like protein [Ancylobacter sp. 3268]|nr:phage terminase large subunit GpA-like protein [Ancylobacter sp. 3268]
MIAPALAAHSRLHRRIVVVVGAQMGKTETMLDIAGTRLATSPVPILWVAPSEGFIRKRLSPRMDDLLENTSLASLMAPSRMQMKTARIVSGVSLRMAHGGSSGELKSDSIGLALTDEADEMMATLKGLGNPVAAVDARGYTYADFVHVITSTPSEGVAEVERDEESGLDFWSCPEDEEELQAQVQSTIWRLWLSGTRYHWAWPCPHCAEYFIPRFECLKWEKPKGKDGKERPSTPVLAGKTAYLQCPQGCADPILESHKEEMNRRGVYVAPGQRVTSDGIVHGLPPESWTISYWASGLCSPFVSFGQRAAEYVEAVRSGNPGDVQTAKNAGFGELYAPGGGDVPEWKEVQNCAIDSYKMGVVPAGSRVLTMTVDVQKDRLVFTVRAWGAFGTSWLVDAAELMGAPEDEDVWAQLADIITDPKAYSGMPLKLVLVDSGFRPGKPYIVPEHRVYAFARRFPNLVRATKGSSRPMRKPISVSKIDIKINGKEIKKGIDLVFLDPDYLKSWVQQKVRWLHNTPGSWYLPKDITEDYCRQIVAEARTVAPNGKVKWARRSRENHFLDCEAMQGAALVMLNLSKLRDGPPLIRRAAADPPPDVPPPSGTPPASPPRQGARRSSSFWGGRKESFW